MIKFRKPLNNSMMIENLDSSHGKVIKDNFALNLILIFTDVAQAQLVPNHPGTPGTHPQNTNFSSFVLEDWQLAGKYKRKAITEEEIGFINVQEFILLCLISCKLIFITISERRPSIT